MNTRSAPASISLEAHAQRTEESDLALVERAAGGDKDAFRMLVEKYQRRAYGIAYGIVGNAEDALDISQEAFVRVYTNIEGFRRASHFYTWFYRILVNLCVDHIRRRSHDTRGDYDETLRKADTSVLQPSAVGDPARSLEQRELGTRIEEALGRLSPVHRAVLHLREVEGLSYKEISQVMGCSIGTVMSRLFHARRRMQEMLGDYFERTNHEV